MSDTLAAILRSDPDWTALPRETPSAIRRLLRRSLEKDVRSRLSDMSMVRVELRDAGTEPPEGAIAALAPGRRASPWRQVAALIAAVLVAALATGVLVWRVRAPAETLGPLGGSQSMCPPRAPMRLRLLETRWRFRAMERGWRTRSTGVSMCAHLIRSTRCRLPARKEPTVDSASHRFSPLTGSGSASSRRVG